MLLAVALACCARHGTSRASVLALRGGRGADPNRPHPHQGTLTKYERKPPSEYGLSVAGVGKRPEKRLQLYEFEACPFCRKAREALSMLDLEAEIYPCPKSGERYRPEVVRRGGKAQFPWLVDPNTGVEMYESDDIVRYLFSTYGNGGVHWTLAVPPLATLSAMLSSLPRPGMGGIARDSRRPEQPLEIDEYHHL